MEKQVRIIDVTLDNVTEYGFGCLTNPKHIGYPSKLEWMKQRISEGLKIKLLLEDEKAVGFIEYVTGENTWEPIDAKGYLVIQCIWVYPKRFKNKGYGGLLVEECIEEAEAKNLNGVAVVASEKGWITGTDLFHKYVFEEVDDKDDFILLVFKLDESAKEPKFKDIEIIPKKYKGLNLLYSDQCPMITKFVDEIINYCRKENLDLKLHKLNTPVDAQSNPCAFGTFSIIYDNKIVVHNPISATRFKNIVYKELKLKTK